MIKVEIEQKFTIFDVIMNYMGINPYEGSSPIIALKDVYMFLKAIKERKPSILYVKPTGKGIQWDISNYASFERQFTDLWSDISSTFINKDALTLETRTASNEENDIKEYKTLRTDFKSADFVNEIQLKPENKIPIYYRNTYHVPKDIIVIADSYFSKYTTSSVEDIYKNYCV